MTMTRPLDTLAGSACILCGSTLPGVVPGDAIVLTSCASCGHQYVSGFADEAERQRRLDGRYAGRSEEAKQLAEVRRILVDRRDGLIRFHQDIAPLRLPCRLLDTSAAMGGFLWGAGSNGFEVIGLERSARQRQLARQYYDLALVEGDLLDNPLSAGCADIVFLSRDLDESDAPREILAAARRLVASNGVVVVETADAEALSYPGADSAALTSTTAVISNAIEWTAQGETASGEDVWSLLAHPHRFTGAELSRLFAESGFNLIDLYCPSEKVLVAIGAPA